MAEMGTDAGAVQSGNSGTEVISQADHDKVYEQALAETVPAPGDKGGEGEGSDAGTEGDKGTPPTDDAKAKAKEEADKAEAEDRELFKSLGLDPSVQVPKELVPTLKKQAGEIGRLNNELKRWGSQNKQVSDQLRAVQREFDSFKNAAGSTPEARAKALGERLSKIDISKLPQGTQRLLKDEEFLMTWATMQSVLEAGGQTKETGGEGSTSSADDLPDEVKTEIVKTHPDYERVYQSAEFAAWAQALPEEKRHEYAEKVKSAAGNLEILNAFKEDFKKATEQADREIEKAIAEVHPKWREKFASPEFLAWIPKQSRAEQLKLRDTDPRGFIEVLNNFDRYQQAQADLQQREAGRKKKNGALEGLGEVGGGGGISDNLTDEDILNMPDAKFKEFDRKVATGGRK